jgi:hypothetical protein
MRYQMLSRPLINAIAIAALWNIATLAAAEIAPENVKLAPGVVAAAAYESPPTNYVVANPTSVYNDLSFSGTKVTGELARGEHVNAIAKVKGWEWLLVGKDGIGIGYVAISMLSPADKYVP